MKELITYLAQTAALAACSWLVYKTVFSRDSLHRVRRFVLLLMIAGSFALPVCRITLESDIIALTGLDRLSPEEPVSTRVNLPVPFETPGGGDVNQIAAAGGSSAKELSAPVDSRYGVPYILGFVYLVGACAMLAWRAAGVARVRRIMRRAVVRYDYRGIEVLVVADDVQPFSFGGRIVMSESDDGPDREMILRHEATHIRHRHGADLTAVNLAAAVQWFNPFVWLLRRELILVHEIAADGGVIQSGIDTKKYQFLLISKIACAGGLLPVANHFRTSDLHKRIVTMKKKTSRAAALKLLLLLPLIAIALAAFAKTRYVATGAEEPATVVTQTGVVTQTTEPAAQNIAQTQNPGGGQSEDEKTDTKVFKSIFVGYMSSGEDGEKTDVITYDASVDKKKMAFALMFEKGKGMGYKSYGRFGKRTNPITGEEAFHSGIDILSPLNDTICAPYPGVVKSAAAEGNFGNKLVITHADGLETTYAHLADFLVSEGTAVEAGRPIAVIGNTGHSVAKHLHLETRVNGELTEPLETLFGMEIYSSGKAADM
jgi:murein DD-endopeptidase MepM/ murein hydrolase activator NlpD